MEEIMSQKQRYTKQNQIHTKKVMIIAIVVLTLILAVCSILLSSLKAKDEQKQQAILSGNFNSIKDILEYYGCRYIGMKEEATEGFKVDIDTEFKYDLYEEESSNQKFYENVINKIAEFLNYNSFQMFDDSKEEKIHIRVICNHGKIETISINGIEDYFIYMDSQISLKKYKEIKTTELSIQAPELLNCIQNNWRSSSEFGSRESIFQDYHIYFDEGIRTRFIDGKVYHIIFDKNYVNSVVNGFTVGTESDIIISKIGTPSFQNDDKSIIGYKSNEIYVFFEKDQISIYRNIQEDGFEDFFKLVDEFLEDQYSLLDFMNELTYVWPDYEEYTYNQETVFLSYPNKGIDIKLNYDNIDGIVLYNNIGVSQEIVNQYIEHTEFLAQLQVDNVWNAEMRRFEERQSLSTKCKEYHEKFEKEDDRNRGKIYQYYADLDENENMINLYFVSQDEQFVDCELRESITSYIWLSDSLLAYSRSGKGMYYYDLKNQTKGVLMTGDETYQIKAFQNGVLKYDDKEVLIQF